MEYDLWFFTLISKRKKIKHTQKGREIWLKIRRMREYKLRLDLVRGNFACG